MNKLKHFLVPVLLIFATYSIAQDVKSNKKTIRLNNAPSLTITEVSFVDENDNQKAETAEKCFFKLNIKNSGKSVAKDVKIKTLIYDGLKNALSFDESTSVGDIETGLSKTVNVDLKSVGEFEDGVASFRFIAEEANKHNSQPQIFELKLQAKKVPFVIEWYKPALPIIQVNKEKYLLQACISSATPVTKVSIFINSKQIADSRGFVIKETSTCSYFIENEIMLEKGENSVKIMAKNNNETVYSEKRNIIFAEIEYENRLALVIGNSAYKDAPLRNPKNDATAMAKTLRDLNFDVIEIIDGNQQQMQDAVYDFRDRLIQKKGIALLFYAGHGIQSEGENYLIPINHGMRYEEDVKYKAVNANQILDHMAAAGTRMNIVILDACRNNPLPKKNRSTNSRGLAAITAKGGGSIIAFATAPGSVASDGVGENGLYTQELLKAIKTPGLEIGMVFRRVVASVKKLSNDAQIPWTNSSLTGEFYFAK